ncbi:MAG TPA: MBL fold metallo-hydrolase [Solirubrobacterales bacterium]|nr:MBL fold metallo-hydrolase [Solirubrobacterales bacterium]
MTAHLRVLRPAPDLLAFYDGRVPGYRVRPEPNWVDEGAIALGIASYAIVGGDEALVYDTHVSVEHGRAIRRTLEAEGARRLTVLLSHWHLDHVAGTEAFTDCEILAGKRTAEHLREHREAIEAGTLEGPPAIAPLVLPTRTVAAETELAIGARRLRLIPVEIHSDDAVVVWEEATATLLAGDTAEDTVTYVDEPQGFPVHLRDLDKLLALAPEHVLPNHGDPDLIAGGGYGPGLLNATKDYIRFLQRCREEPALRELPLREAIADQVAAGDLRYFEPYEDVHRQNLSTVLAG